MLGSTDEAGNGYIWNSIDTEDARNLNAHWEFLDSNGGQQPVEIVDRDAGGSSLPQEPNQDNLADQRLSAQPQMQQYSGTRTVQQNSPIAANREELGARIPEMQANTR